MVRGSLIRILERMDDMVIGITGGVGCGKSTVMSLLERQWHAKVILADDIGHVAMEPGQPVYREVVEHFGKGILTKDGNIDRAKLADIIYADDDERDALDGIVHPYVLSQIDKMIKMWSSEPLICIETALMYETGCDKMCDRVYCVITDDKVRIRRLMDSRGYTRAKAESIISAQMPDEEYIRMADDVIYNNQDMSYLQKRLQELLCTD